MACTAVLWDDANRPTGAGGASDPGAKETRRFFLVPLLGLVNGVAAREEGEGPGGEEEEGREDRREEEGGGG